jgi:hypothetical protein
VETVSYENRKADRVVLQSRDRLRQCDLHVHLSYGKIVEPSKVFDVAGPGALCGMEAAVAKKSFGSRRVKFWRRSMFWSRLIF